jgi:stage V sporulation protein D (sporulation-specific penicillin-binding protein)
MRKRVAFLFLFSLACLGLLVGRLGWLQLVRGEELRSKGDEARTRDTPIEARRGAILDRNLKELAISVNVDSVYAVPIQVKAPEESAKLLAGILGLEENGLLTELKKRTFFVWVKRKVDDETSNKIKALKKEGKLEGIALTQESKRFYPKGNLASSVIGISGIDSQGLGGLEYQYDKYLKGEPGRLVGEYDARGRQIPDANYRYFQPVDGDTLVLTIDETLQFIAERDLEKAMLEHQAASGTVIVMDPNNGEVLALAQRPDYDPNHWQDYPAANRRIIPVSDTYYPGSVFKPVTAAAALEEGVVRMTDSFYCPGFVKVPGATINCWKASGHGAETFSDVIKNSCNVGFVQVGLNRLGTDKFYKYLQAFGFMDLTGIDLPGEAKAIMPAQKDAKPVDTAVMSFGQTLTVTPIQMATAMSVIANGGTLVKPHVVKEIRDPQGKTVATIGKTEVRRVMTEVSSRELRQAMERVIEEGTGKTAFIEGYHLAGKTGTSQKSVGGRVSSDSYIASFIGYGPADTPRLLVLVVVDEPSTGLYFGGQVAGPVFQAIMRDAYRYLEIPISYDPAKAPADTKTSVGVPDVVGSELAKAKNDLHQRGLEWRVEGDGDRVYEQTPPGGVQVPAGTTIILRVGSTGGGSGTDSGQTGTSEVLVPSVIGKTIREAGEILGSFGLKINPTGTGLAKAQDPRPGVKVPRGSIVNARFEPPPP